MSSASKAPPPKTKAESMEYAPAHPSSENDAENGYSDDSFEELDLSIDTLAHLNESHDFEEGALATQGVLGEDTFYLACHFYN